MASSSFTYEYDVFISFRGADTRYSFTGNLYSALHQKGIRTFIDDRELHGGDEITPSLLKAIEESRIAIIVLSQNYAFSVFCLDELTAILECFQKEEGEKKKNSRMVYPVFYDVNPSDVRNCSGSFGEALVKHVERFNGNTEKVQKWKMALNQAANLSGFELKIGFGSYEYELIKKIVDHVSGSLHRPQLHVANYPVGLEPRVEKVISLLNLGSDDRVLVVGIWGLGGIGKTTVARAVFNTISCQFDCMCFLEEVRERTIKHGLEHLQETVLFQICRDKDINIPNANDGISLIRQRLSQKKVLLVFDDVDQLEQLEAFAGITDCVGCGSRVIITTRDRHLLEFHGIKRMYEVEGFSEKEAHDLLCWKAFKTDNVNPSYADVLNRAITYASGLPLALELLGSNMFGKSIEELQSYMYRVEIIPHKAILEVLRLSFDSLDVEEKKTFLDIACFFNGHKLADVEDMLCAHYGVYVKYSIEMLIERSLMKIDDGLVILHDLIQDMGREIVRQESPCEPGKRSRLWLFQDVVKVLEENSGSSRTESLFLDFPKDEEVLWDGMALREMRNLRTLVIRNGRFNKGPTHLPNSLRVLIWWGYPSPSLPHDFHPKKLAILDLRESRLRKSEPIQFKSLKDLDFSYCDWLTHIPDVSGLPNLEKLSFRHCENLILIHESVGFLGKLRILDAGNCKKLGAFPPIRLTSLEQLNLSYCPILESIPEILGKMENVKELCIIGSPIKDLPFSIQNLNQLRGLELRICGMVQLPSSIVMLPQLGFLCVSRCQGLQLSKLDIGEELETKSSETEDLILSYCNISDDFLPICLTWFANVKKLDLSGNNFTIVHACIKEFHFLTNLKLDDCRHIREITGIPRKLETFSAKRCLSLNYMDLSGDCDSLSKLILDDCVCLQEIKGILPNLDHFSAKNCTLLTSWCTSMLMNQESVEGGNRMFSFPGTKIPDWFVQWTSGEPISFSFRGKFPAISLCLVIGLVDEQPITVKFSPKVFMNDNELSLVNQKVYKFKIATDHILLVDVRLLGFEDNEDAVFSNTEWNHVVVSYEDHITNRVPIKEVAKYSGIHVFIKQASRLWDIQFTNPQQTLINVNTDPSSMMGPLKSIEMKRPQEEQTTALSLSHKSMQPPSPPAEDEQGLVPQTTFPVKIPSESEDVGRETSERLSENEVYATTIQNDHPFKVGKETSERLSENEVHAFTVQNDPSVTQRCSKDDYLELEAISSCEHESEESSSNTIASDSDDPFDQVNRKLRVSGQETTSSGASSGDASLRSIREVVNALELVIDKDLPDISTDTAVQSELHQLLDLLSTSSHPKVTAEVKEAIVGFKRKVFASFREFQATLESVNKLKNFENHLARIHQETVIGKGLRKDLKNSIKEVSLAIKAKNRKKKNLEAEIGSLRKQLATKEWDLEQVILNIKNQEATLTNYSTSYASINEQALALLKEADDLLAASSGIRHDGETAEVELSRLKSSWSIDLATQLNKIKSNILGL